MQCSEGWILSPALFFFFLPLKIFKKDLFI